MCFNAVPPDPLPGWGAWMEGRAYLTNRCDWNIIYLTRQPVREVKAPRPGDYKKLRSSRLFFTREQGGYFLCVYVRIDTIKLAVVRIIIKIS